jgi:hypothetical protein
VRKVSKDKLERWRSLSEAKKKKRIIIWKAPQLLDWWSTFELSG